MGRAYAFYASAQQCFHNAPMKITENNFRLKMVGPVTNNNKGTLKG
jgi:hypothetical protein